jgi:hypothetical protein
MGWDCWIYWVRVFFSSRVGGRGLCRLSSDARGGDVSVGVGL